MATSDDNSERIESYLSGRMDEAEERAFRREMEADEALRKDVEAYEIIYKGFRSKRMEAFAKKMEAFEAGEEPLRLSRRPAIVIPLRGRWLYAVAAAALVLVAAAIWLFRPGGSDAALAMDAATVPDLRGFRGVEAGEEPFMLGFNNFKSGQYGRAIAALETIADGRPRYADAQYVLGWCYLEERRFAAAAEAFGRARARVDDLTLLIARDAPATLVTGQHVDWPLALALLADGRRAEALPMFDAIGATPGHPYREEAARLAASLR